MAGSNVTIYGALAANLAIAVTKFVAAGYTGSAAMLSEGIHSAVDSGNQVLLLIGTRMAARKASPEFPFGHGKEIYFWSLIVAILIFGLGGGLSVYEGVMHILEPEPLTDPTWNYVVLAAAALFEGTSFTIAMRAFQRERASRPFWESLHGSKDPTTYTVLAEDGAALAGLALAALGVWSSHRFGLPTLDGAASVAIGALLAGVAVVLIGESRGLLIGEGIRAETAEAIRAIVIEQPIARRVGRILSMYMGPDEILLTLDVEFDPQATAAQVAAAVARMEAGIRQRYAKITRIYIEAQAIGRGGEANDAGAAG